MLKIVKKIAIVAVLFTVVACAGNDGRYVQAGDNNYENNYVNSYGYENSGDFYYGGWK